MKSKMRRSQCARLARFEGRGIALSLATLSYLELNETAVRIWDLLEATGSPIEVFRILRQEVHGVSDQELMEDILAICRDFVGAGLWVIV